ncbi:MAG: hypothetical protein LBC76_12050 [Treponema sp.]|jgi:hypothetical protein|nr:hypothetical protein [Treponema sp.]
MASDNKILFLIHNGEILFNDSSHFLYHKDWAKTIGIVNDEFSNTVRGTCKKVEGKWHADFYYDYDREDGRCAAAARKFAPEIMKICKTSSLEIFSDEEPFTIRKKDYKSRV